MESDCGLCGLWPSSLRPVRLFRFSKKHGSFCFVAFPLCYSVLGFWWGFTLILIISFLLLSFPLNLLYFFSFYSRTFELELLPYSSYFNFLIYSLYSSVSWLNLFFSFLLCLLCIWGCLVNFGDMGTTALDSGNVSK